MQYQKTQTAGLTDQILLHPLLFPGDFRWEPIAPDGNAGQGSGSGDGVGDGAAGHSLLEVVGGARGFILGVKLPVMLLPVVWAESEPLIVSLLFQGIVCLCSE
jgi:hypothetical protein